MEGAAASAGAGDEDGLRLPLSGTDFCKPHTHKYMDTVSRLLPLSFVVTKSKYAVGYLVTKII